jgi:hypothetical protein
LIDPSELLRQYVQFKDEPQDKQALELLKLLLRFSENQDSSRFPINTLLYDWGLIKSHIDPNKAEPLISEAFPGLMKKAGPVTEAVTFLMNPPKKRTFVSLMLKEYDDYMVEQKRFCIPENMPKANTEELNGDQVAWMSRCFPPTMHMEIAKVLNMDNEGAYLNNPEPVIKAAREFVALGPLASYDH